VDALDEPSTERHLDQVVEEFGGVDISFNAVGLMEVQGVPLVDLSRNGRLPDGRVTAINQIAIQGKAATETVLTVRIQVH
jgi:hypothetical protein